MKFSFLYCIGLYESEVTTCAGIQLFLYNLSLYIKTNKGNVSKMKLVMSFLMSNLNLLYNCSLLLMYYDLLLMLF